MSNEAEDSSKFALFPREGLDQGEGGRVKPDSEGAREGAGDDAPLKGSVTPNGSGNLSWGVLLTVGALVLSGVGHRLAPVEARVALITGGVLVLGHYVMTSMRVFARPNGFFLGLSLAFLLVTAVPVGMSVWQGAADYASRIRVTDVADSRNAASTVSPPAVPVTVAPISSVAGAGGEKADLRAEAFVEKPNHPAAAGGLGTGLVEGSQTASVATPAGGAVEEKLSVEEREAKIAAMAEISAPVVKKVVPSKGLATGGLPGEDVSLGQGNVSVGSVQNLSQKEFNEKVLQSKLQVVQRYPALGRNGSEEVKVYTEVFNELVRRSRDFFLNPDWPLELAELVGKREGWIPEEGSTRK